MASLWTRMRNDVRRRVAERWGAAWTLRARWISSEEKGRAQAFLDANQDRLTFVLGAGRSGTQFLADLLDEDAHAAFFHEPDFTADVAAMDRLRRDPALAERYWREIRAVQVVRRWSTRALAGGYGEVTGTIRYHARALAALYPRARLFLLARDGRDAVRSVMGFPRFYSRGASGAYALEPLPGDPLHAAWSDLGRFEKVCWAWRDTYETLIATIPPERWLTLERLVADHEYFQERLATVIGASIPRDAWRARATRGSVNASARHAFPAWRDWSSKQRSAFESICGPTMARLGYAV